MEQAALRTRPNDLDDPDLVLALEHGWGITAAEIAYVPLGFGSHHWTVVGDRRWFLMIPSRAELEASLETTSGPWGPGPYAVAAQRLVAKHAGVLGELLLRYDALATEVAASDRPQVLTHGEPHRGNTITTPAGTVLIDWDTARLAPPERDLWSLIGEDPAVAERYQRQTGRTIEPDAIALYRLWWDFCEVSLYTADFRAPHDDTEDARLGWQGLVNHLDPARWTDVLSAGRRRRC